MGQVTPAGLTVFVALLLVCGLLIVNLIRHSISTKASSPSGRPKHWRIKEDPSVAVPVTSTEHPQTREDIAMPDPKNPEPDDEADLDEDRGEDEGEEEELSAETLKAKLEKCAMPEERAAAITMVTTELWDDNNLSTDEIVDLLNEAELSTEEMAKAMMVGWEDNSGSIVGSLVTQLSLAVGQLAEVLFPLMPGDTDAEKAKALADAYSSAMSESSIDDQTENEIVGPLIRHGLSVDEVFRILYEDDERNFWDVVGYFDSDQLPAEKCLALATELEVDLDSDFMDSLKNEYNLELEDTVEAFKKSGKSVQDIVDQLDGTDLDELLKVLRGVGYGDTESLLALYHSDDDNYSDADIIESAVEQEIPLQAIVAFINQAEMDIEELENSLAENGNLEFRLRIELIHAALFLSQPTPVVTAEPTPAVTEPPAAPEEVTEPPAEPVLDAAAPERDQGGVAPMPSGWTDPDD